ncbi:DUF1810 domain-containing protein [Methylocella sp.]|uniref:DUF1810 domain-containing protein n=1 Tax=Methylocella sp. TaxID=1978226 RepID=UPI0037832370
MAQADDPFDLARFVAAQDGVLETAMAELRAGRKRSHWMWFVFPQIAGLGASAMARRYAISGIEEAQAYLAHELLGPRLKACARLVMTHEGLSARDIFGAPDDAKVFSSLTLFAEAAQERSEFSAALDTFFRGARDAATLDRLGTDARLD